MSLNNFKYSWKDLQRERINVLVSGLISELVYQKKIQMTEGITGKKCSDNNQIEMLLDKINTMEKSKFDNMVNEIINGVVKNI